MSQNTIAQEILNVSSTTSAKVSDIIQGFSSLPPKANQWDTCFRKEKCRQFHCWPTSMRAGERREGRTTQGSFLAPDKYFPKLWGLFDRCLNNLEPLLCWMVGYLLSSKIIPVSSPISCPLTFHSPFYIDTLSYCRPSAPLGGLVKAYPTFHSHAADTQYTDQQIC